MAHKFIMQLLPNELVDDIIKYVENDHHKQIEKLKNIKIDESGSLYDNFIYWSLYKNVPIDHEKSFENEKICLKNGSEYPICVHSVCINWLFNRADLEFNECDEYGNEIEYSGYLENVFNHINEDNGEYKYKYKK